LDNSEISLFFELSFEIEISLFNYLEISLSFRLSASISRRLCKLLIS